MQRSGENFQRLSSSAFPQDVPSHGDVFSARPISLCVACGICLGCCVEPVWTCFCTQIRICSGSLVLCTDNFVRVMFPGDLTEQTVHTPENPLETVTNFAVLEVPVLED